jgi:hypothetical protein
MERRTTSRGPVAHPLAIGPRTPSRRRSRQSATDPRAPAVEGGSTLVAVEAVSPVSDAGVFEVSNGTAFSNDGTKVGAGTLPLPPECRCFRGARWC